MGVPVFKVSVFQKIPYLLIDLPKGLAGI